MSIYELICLVSVSGMVAVAGMTLPPDSPEQSRPIRGAIAGAFLGACIWGLFFAMGHGIREMVEQGRQQNETITIP